MYKILYVVHHKTERHEGCTKYVTQEEAQKKADFANTNFGRAFHWVQKEKP